MLGRLFTSTIGLLLAASLAAPASAADYRGTTAGWPSYANGYYAAGYPANYAAGPAYYVARPIPAAGYTAQSPGMMYMPTTAAYANKRQISKTAIMFEDFVRDASERTRNALGIHDYCHWFPSLRTLGFALKKRRTCNLVSSISREESWEEAEAECGLPSRFEVMFLEKASIKDLA